MTSIQIDENVANALEVESQAAAPSPTLSADDIVAMIEAESSADGSEYRGTYSRKDIYLDHD
jgi:hypothetical protein